MASNNDGSQGEKIGWICDYVPEELIMAAGMEPVRLEGQMENVKEADSYLFSNVCPYVKHILEAGLNRETEDLAGIIFTNSCDGMRRLHDLWNHYVGSPFMHMLEIPKHRDEKGLHYFREQLEHLKRELERFTGKEISSQGLKGAVSLLNDRRGRIMDLFERQKQEEPPYRGSELLDLCLEETTRPKEETARIIQEMGGRPSNALSTNPRPRPVRILVTGNVLDKPNLFRIIESAGAEVVAFDTCLGLRHYTDPVETEADPISSLARRYLLRPPCNRMPGLNEKIERMRQLSRDYTVDGVIQSRVKFCDYALLESPVLENFAKNRDLPFLSLENDYLWADEARMKTRVEAFLEMIRESD